MTHPHHSTLANSLARRSLPTNPIWLSLFLSSHPHPALSSSSSSSSSAAAAVAAELLSTATQRILASDIKTTLSTSSQHILPHDINSPTAPEKRLPRDVVVQVLDLMDVATSLAVQVEALEMLARGEGRGQGRGVVVRVVNGDAGVDDDGDDGGGAGHGGAGRDGTGGKGVWKVLMQDAAGTLVWGFDWEGMLDVDVDVGVGAGTGLMGYGGQQGQRQNVVRIGSKILLRKGCLFARGVALVERQTVSVLGGMIEDMEKAWREDRLTRLKSLLPVSERT